MSRWLGNLAVMAIGLLMGFLLLEGGVRLAGFRPYASIADPLLGHRYRANAAYLHVGEEGRSNGRYNSAGWRDAEHAGPKPNGTTRILMLGDSYVSAFQVPLDSTFHRRLEQRLNARALAGHRFEVIALGMDGNGTASEYLTYRHWGNTYDPDVVAVAFVQNDPADNWKPAALETRRPFLIERGDSLALDTSFNEDPGFQRWARRNWLRENSALWSMARGALANMGSRKSPPRVIAGEAQDGYYRSWNFDRRVLPDTLTPFRITEKIYAHFARDVASDGRRFVVFHVGFAQQEHRPNRDSLRAADPDFDENKSARWLISVGERHGFPVVPLSPAFRAASDAVGGRPLWFGNNGLFGHWNAEGHGITAEAMARYFARTLPGLDSTGTTSADVPGVAELERR
ncbi:MAG: hypothetical protein ABIS67_08585 [Candidatus Eisenbacteria bacterium]